MWNSQNVGNAGASEKLDEIVEPFMLKLMLFVIMVMSGKPVTQDDF